MSFERTLLFEIETCCKCSCVFAMLAAQQKELKTNGGTFYCPNGHAQVYTKSEVQKLRERLEASEAARASNLRWAEDTERRLSATRGVVTRIKRRVGNGVCPCCNRSFANVGRHMANKHPDYKTGVA